MAKVGIREVARVAGVSQGTVSHYLNHPDRVSDEKAERIRQAIVELGFVRNDAARQLRLGTSSTIAYLNPGVSNPFFTAVAEGAEERAAEHGVSMLLANSNSTPERENAYLDLFERQGVRGLLVASHRSIEDRLKDMRDRGTPSVLVGRAASRRDQPAVFINEETGGYLAAKHLLDLGRRQLAFVGGPLSIPQVAGRFQGASNAVREHGDATIELIDTPRRVISDGATVAEGILRRGAARRPDAIVAVNDLVAIGVVQALVSAGVRVPDDLAVVGYDDIEFGRSAIVPLTTIRQPHEEFGAAAVDLLLSLSEPGAGEQPEPLIRMFEPELVVRASTVSPEA
ncbi:MAG: LacI family DNA-binding transcriptional regulator [Mycetocola sp.]